MRYFSKKLFSKLINQCLLLVILTVINSFWILPVYAEMTDVHVTALVEALRQAAPKTGIENDDLYSDWQIKPSNIASWSKACVGEELTPTEFEKNSEIARQILKCKMGEVLLEQYQLSGNDESVAIQRAAAWWMTGDADAPSSHYAQKVLQFYQQQRGGKLQKQTKPPVLPAEAQVLPSTSEQLSTEQPLQKSPRPPLALATNLTETQLDAFVEALRLAAPQATVDNDGLYSQWQIKPSNISRWSKRCLGKELTPEEAEVDTHSMRYIVKCKMSEVLSEQYRLTNEDESVAVCKAAAWWMTGDPEQYIGSAAIYSQKVLDFYRQSLSN